MTDAPLSLELLTDLPTAPGRIELVLPEIGGGKLKVADLDRIEQFPRARAIRVSGLKQAVFEVLVARHGEQFQGLYLWKCPRIDDLSPLESMPHLTHFAAYWNQRTDRLWDMEQTPRLSGLEIMNFNRLHALGELGGAESLRELVLGRGLEGRSVVDSLEPLAGLSNLEQLGLYLDRVEDERVQPLAQLRNLKELDAPTRLWTTEQCAWLRAHLPASTAGNVLQPVVHLKEPILGTDKDVYLVGKRKPLLSSKRHAARIAKHISLFERLVEQYKADPELEP